MEAATYSPDVVGEPRSNEPDGTRNLALQDQQQRISWRIQDLAWFGSKTIGEAQRHIGEPDRIKLGTCTAAQIIFGKVVLHLVTGEPERLCKLLNLRPPNELAMPASNEQSREWKSAARAV